MVKITNSGASVHRTTFPHYKPSVITCAYSSQQVCDLHRNLHAQFWRKCSQQRLPSSQPSVTTCACPSQQVCDLHLNLPAHLLFTPHHHHKYSISISPFLFV